MSFMIKNDEVLEKYEICNVIKNKIGIKQQNKKNSKFHGKKNLLGTIIMEFSLKIL